jgi:hypothetical protein
MACKFRRRKRLPAGRVSGPVARSCLTNGTAGARATEAHAVPAAEIHWSSNGNPLKWHDWRATGERTRPRQRSECVAGIRSPHICAMLTARLPPQKGEQRLAGRRHRWQFISASPHHSAVCSDRAARLMFSFSARPQSPAQQHARSSPVRGPACNSHPRVRSGSTSLPPGKPQCFGQEVTERFGYYYFPDRRPDMARPRFQLRPRLQGIRSPTELSVIASGA